MITPKRLKKIVSAVQNRKEDIVVVLEDIHDPHNAAAIWRTCDAFGVQTVYLIFEKEKPYNPKQIGKGSSSSANKWLDFIKHSSTKECFGQLKNDGFSIVGTVLSDKTVSLYDVDLSKGKVALVFGNEHAGLSEDAIRLCDMQILIPMTGMVQSLNVSVTAGICMYETIRQRQKYKEVPSGTSPYHKNLLERYLAKR